MRKRTLCLCCRQKGRLNQHRLCRDCAVCLHCEKQPSCTELGLCVSCHDQEATRVLYLRRRGWTPEWEQHLRRKTREVQDQLKLIRLQGTFLFQPGTDSGEDDPDEA